MSDLIERLRRIEHGWCYGSGTVTTNWQRNPDGPEAADEIERLRGLLLRMRPCLHAQWKAEIDAALGTESQPSPCQHDLCAPNTTVLTDGEWATCPLCGENWHFPRATDNQDAGREGK